MAPPHSFLPEVERLGPQCIRVLGGNPSKFTLQGTNTYLLGAGSRRILIDTGEGRPSWAAAIKTVLQAEGAKIDTVLLSHWHHDHVGGVKDLRAICPEAQIFKHRPIQGQHDIRDGQTFTLEGLSLTAMHTPGHTADHMVFVWGQEDAMFTADNVLGHGTAVFEDLTAYMSSLERMRHMFRGKAYPGHGPVIEDGPAKVDEYIRHRIGRKEQVIRTLGTVALAADPISRTSLQEWTVLGLVKTIYADVPEELHGPASGGVLQILRKLEVEGKVTHIQARDTWVLHHTASASL